MLENKNFLMILVIFLVCILPVSAILVIATMDGIMSKYYEVPLWIRIVSCICLLAIVAYGREMRKP